MKNGFLKKIFESGYVYAPYIPMQVTRNFNQSPKYKTEVVAENINKIIAMHWVLDTVQFHMVHRVGNPHLRKRTVDFDVSNMYGFQMRYYDQYCPLRIRVALNWLRQYE